MGEEGKENRSTRLPMRLQHFIQPCHLVWGLIRLDLVCLSLIHFGVWGLEFWVWALGFQGFGV